MNNLTTRKIVLGLLMALVLAFSVQGIADALTLSKTSGDLQTKTVDSSFEISFTVGLTTSTSITNSRGETITDESAPRVIDAQGHVLTDRIGGTRYRESTAAADTGGFRYEVLGDTGYPNPPGDPNGDGNNWIATSGAHVDSNGNVVDAEGRAIYTNQALSIRATAAPAAAVDDSIRFNYNDEAIAIGVTGGTIDFELTSSGYPVDAVDNASRSPNGAATAATASLYEMDPVRGLPNSVTLRCMPEAVGTYEIRIRDVTPIEDFPRNIAPPQSNITFTLYVVDDTLQTTANAIEPKDEAVYFAGETIQLDTYFNFYAVAENGTRTLVTDPANVHLNYQVTEGPGTVYVRTSDRDTTTPTKNLLTSASADVYLNMNNGRNVVIASIAGQDPGTEGARIVFNYTGTGAVTTTTTPTTTTTTTGTGTPSLSIATSGTGTTRTVTVTATTATGTDVPGILVTLSSTDFSLTQAVTTGTPTSITFPSTLGSYTLLATHPAGVYTQGRATVTIGSTGLGTLSISPVGTAVNGVQTVGITARTADGAVPAGALAVTLSGTGFTTTGASVLGGSVSAGVTLPTTAATYTLFVRATGYNEAFTRLTVSTTTTRGPAGVADSIEISGQRQLSGTVNESEPLRVRVLDANDNGVEDVTVTFRVLAPGRGTFSGGRGNRRGVTDETDRNGYASANFTPSDDGDIIVRASAAGVSADVTFIIDVGEAADEPEPPTPSRDVPPSREINPVVHVGAASRPPMLWVDGGAIYALVGASEQRFAPGVDNAMNIVIGGGKVYWTEKTGESAGTINSANLDGTDVKELKSIQAVPMGIAVDTAGSKLYWTNSRGRIQSANLDGSVSQT